MILIILTFAGLALAFSAGGYILGTLGTALLLRLVSFSAKRHRGG